MTPDQIIQLRTKLKKVAEMICMGECRTLIYQALALLPCETCNGSEIKKPESGCGDCLAGDGNCFADCPCPDCQPRTCVCCEEVTEENAHLHRNCGK